MFNINDILGISSEADFEDAALELFRFQSRHCAPYREYLKHIGVDPLTVKDVSSIPFLPIELFKSHNVYCGEKDAEIVFTSSSTSGQGESKHRMASKSDYEKTFSSAFEMFYGPAEHLSIYALLPGYLEREGSSLIYMVENLINQAGRGGFYLSNHDKLLQDMEADPGKKILLGVSHALWDLADKEPRKLDDTIIMETGGMKGKRKELPKEEFHTILKTAFGVNVIHSEYGMAELCSQAYSKGHGVFTTPSWMKVHVRDLNDPFHLFITPATGGINIIDLANLNSCAFIQTHDLGTVYKNGTFSILGRIDHSEIRGCNLLVQ